MKIFRFETYSLWRLRFIFAKNFYSFWQKIPFIIFILRKEICQNEYCGNTKFFAKMNTKIQKDECLPKWIQIFLPKRILPKSEPLWRSSVFLESSRYSMAYQRNLLNFFNTFFSIFSKKSPCSFRIFKGTVFFMAGLLE